MGTACAATGLKRNTRVVVKLAGGAELAGEIARQRTFGGSIQHELQREVPLDMKSHCVPIDRGEPQPQLASVAFEGVDLVAFGQVRVP